MSDEQISKKMVKMKISNQPKSFNLQAYCVDLSRKLKEIEEDPNSVGQIDISPPSGYFTPEQMELDSQRAIKYYEKENCVKHKIPIKQRKKCCKCEECKGLCRFVLKYGSTLQLDDPGTKFLDCMFCTKNGKCLKGGVSN